MELDKFAAPKKPRSLRIDPSSNLRLSDPDPQGWRGMALKLLGFYSRQSRLIRGSKTLYSRVSSHVERPELYASKFCGTFSMKIPSSFLIRIFLTSWSCMLASFQSGTKFQDDTRDACAAFVAPSGSVKGGWKRWCHCGSNALRDIQP